MQEEPGLTGLPAIERAAFVSFVADSDAREITRQHAHLGTAGGSQESAPASVMAGMVEVRGLVALVPPGKTAEVELEPYTQPHLVGKPTPTAAPDGENTQ